MNLQQFNTLDAGNEIVNAMTGGRGRVTTVTEDRRGRTVTVSWGPGVTFAFTAQSNAWLHWDKIEELGPKEST